MDDIRFIEFFGGCGGFSLGLERANLENFTPERQNILAGGVGPSIASGGQELGTTIASSEDSRNRRVQPEGNGTGGKSETEPTQFGKPHFRCVWYCDNDRYAVRIYNRNFRKTWRPTDARRVNPESIPDFDLLCAGFPCQSFSIAGKRGGFQDTRGTLFFEIARVAKVKRPRLLFLENVRGLFSHDEGRTYLTILATLDELGYDVEWEVLNSKHFGVPQNRERVFIIGHRRDIPWEPIFPLGDGGKIDAERPSPFERVFWLSEGLSKDIGVLSIQRQGKSLLPAQMSKVSEQVYAELQTGESREIQREGQSIQQDGEGSLQEVETVDSWEAGLDESGRVSGVVRIPTQSLLLLWIARGRATDSEGRIQQQDISALNRQTRLYERIRKGESGSLLLAVQSHQGRLLFSLGDGTDWLKLCEKEVGESRGTLSSILEENPGKKYFLSAKAVKSMLEHQRRHKEKGNGFGASIATIGKEELDR